MKQFLIGIGVSLLPLQNALAQEELAKKMDPTTLTILGTMVLGVILAVAWVFYADWQEKRNKERRRGNKSVS